MPSNTYARSRSALEWKKPLSFGLWAALGTLLCAALGELWLAFTMPPPLPPPPPPPPPPPQAVVLVLDTSYSMEMGDAISEMKRAALDYVARQDLTRTRIGVVGFDSKSRVLAPLTRDAATLQNAINSLTLDGLTRMDLGLSAALTVAPAPASATTAVAASSPVEAGERRSVLLFTDGYPESEDDSVDPVALTREMAATVRQSGARLVAIGSGGSDVDFLGELTGDPKMVFSASDGQFAEAFKLAENAINSPTGRALIQSKAVENYDAGREFGRIAVWTGLIGLGISSALLLAQGAYSRRRLGSREVVGIGAGLLAGLVAGALGQWMFTQAGDSRTALALGRLLAWATGGALLGLGIAPFVPNLSLVRAGLGGALGGWIGAMGFVLVARLSNDIAGRVLGAAIIGFAIGVMVVLAEVAFRKAWLHVSYGARDAFDLNLGAQPVAVGSDRAQCRILARETSPVAARYLFENGQPCLVDRSGGRHTLQSGDKRRFGNVEITLCTESGEMATPQIAPQPVGGLVAQPHASAPVFAAPLPAKSAWMLQGAQSIALPATGTVSIGRVEGNAIVLADAGISSRHATLKVGENELSVCDLGSTNGTFVNGTRLNPHVPAPLQNGDQLRLGRLEFVVGHA